MTPDSTPDESSQSYDGHCPLTLFMKTNRKIAIQRRNDGVNQPRFGPRLATAHYRMIAGTVRQGCHLFHSRNPERYTDADPFKLLYVDPKLIERMSGRPNREYGSVVEGDWDQGGTPIETDRCYRSLRQHFQDDVPWDETPLFEWFYDRIDAGDPTAWTADQYRSRFESLDDVYQQIRRKGYKTQRELFAENAEQVLKQNNDCIHPYLNEVGVDISRDGQLLWRSGGRHRLFITKLLGLSEIPVKVWSRHRQWQQVRNRLRDGRSPEIEAESMKPPVVDSHPDLGDIEQMTHKT